MTSDRGKERDNQDKGDALPAARLKFWGVFAIVAGLMVVVTVAGCLTTPLCVAALGL